MNKIAKKITSKVCLITIVLLGIFSNLSAQDTGVVDSLTNFQKERYFTINIDVLSVSLQYEKIIKNNWYGGIEILGGFGYRKILNKPIIIDNIHIFKLYEMMKVELFVSNYFSRYFYHTLGLSVSIITPGEGLVKLASGLEYGFYFGSGLLRLGLRLQFGSVFSKINRDRTIIYGSFTPLVIQFKL